MITVQALLFDLDGTLIDSRRDLVTAVQHLQKKWSHPVSSDDAIAGFVGDGIVKLVQRALPELTGDLLEAVEDMKDFYRRHCLDHTKLYPGVKETLDHFRGKELAIVTNKPARVSQRILQGLGVVSEFKVLVGGDSLANKKPHAEPILHALSALHVLPKEAVMVGDGVNDILAGRAAGTWTCGIESNIGDPQALHKAQPDFVVLNTMDLMRLFN